MSVGRRTIGVLVKLEAVVGAQWAVDDGLGGVIKKDIR